MKRLLALLPLLLLWAASSQAQCAGGGTHTLADGNSATVMACLNSINVDNTTVNIPSGTWNWSTSNTYNQTNSFILHGNGQATGATTDGLGNPTGYTDATNLCTTTGANSNAFLIVNTLSGKTVQITGITFASGGPCAVNANPMFHGIIEIIGNSHSIRFNNNHVVANFGTNGSEAFTINGFIWGVADRNLFENPGSGNNVNFLELLSGNWNNSGENFGHASWNDVSNFGTQDFFFFENNTIKGFGTAFDCETGGRFVLRKTSIIGQDGQTHGTGHVATTADRGCRAFEFYQNNLNGTGAISGSMVDYEGGTSLWWGNTATNYGTFIREFYRRICNVSNFPNQCTYTQVATPNGWGNAGNSFTGNLPSTWDTQTGDQGYPALDQTGRGKGDLLTGNFPATANSALGGQTYPRQALDPVYVWGQSSTIGTVAEWVNYVNGPISDLTAQENRDYYLELPNNTNTGATFDGTKGIGCGAGGTAGSVTATCAHPLVRPGTCTAGVGYWNTGTNTLSVCTGNAWNESYYTPFTYPHPLVAGAPVLTFSPTTVVFGNQNVGTTSAIITVTVSNTGTANQVLATPYFSFAGTNPTNFANAGTGTCANGGTIAPSTSCTVNVTFTPSATGARSAVLNIQGTVFAGVNLSGTGTASGLTISPTPIAFGNQQVGTTSGGMTVTVTNTGTGSITLATPFFTLTGTNAADIARSGGTCANAGVLAASGTCTIILTFSPGASGARTATLNVSGN